MPRLVLRYRAPRMNRRRRSKLLAVFRTLLVGALRRSLGQVLSGEQAARSQAQHRLHAAGDSGHASATTRCVRCHHLSHGFGRVHDRHADVPCRLVSAEPQLDSECAARALIDLRTEPLSQRFVHVLRGTTEGCVETRAKAVPRPMQTGFRSRTSASSIRAPSAGRTPSDVFVRSRTSGSP